MPTQYAIPPGRLINTSQNLGVNGHTTRCTSPVSVVLRLRLVSGYWLQETEISAAVWAHEALEELYFLLKEITFKVISVALLTFLNLC